jgi:hypothetical protein
LDPDTREAALVELSKKREQYDDLALVLWHAFGRSSFSYQPHFSPHRAHQVLCQPSYRRLSPSIQCSPRRT